MGARVAAGFGFGLKLGAVHLWIIRGEGDLCMRFVTLQVERTAAYVLRSRDESIGNGGSSISSGEACLSCLCVLSF